MSTKRTSKKLLVGLGSTIGLASTVAIGGFGVKSIIDATINNINMSDESTSGYAINSQYYKNIPGLNVATRDMFIETQGLVPHLGHVGIGQTVTPFGSLGTYRSANPAGYGENTLALVSWSGTVLWVNNDSKKHIYDAKYEANTNTILVVRTADVRGRDDVTLQIIDARSGHTINSIELGQMPLAWELYNGYQGNESFFNNMYYQDFIYLGNNTILWTYWVDVNHAKNKWNNGGGRIALDQASKLQTSGKTIAIKINNDTAKFANVNIESDPNGKFLNAQQFYENADANSNWINTEKADYYLITTPFVTLVRDRYDFSIDYNHAQITLHALVGKRAWNYDDVNASQNQKYHLKMTYRIDISDGNNLGRFSGEKKWGIENISSDYIELGPGWAATAFFENFDVYNKAYTKITRNMFDQNSIVFPYVFASPGDVTDSGNPFSQSNYRYGRDQSLTPTVVPIWNVAQLTFNSSGGSSFSNVETSLNNDKRSWGWMMGKDIIDTWYQHNYWDLNTQGTQSAGGAPIFYPWPFANGKYWDYGNGQLLYNRLLTVSPFNNTIMYAARPSYIYPSGNQDVFTNNFRSNNQNANYMSIYLSNTSSAAIHNDGGKNRNLVNIVVTNSRDFSGGSLIDESMTNVDYLYQNPFFMDLQALAWKNGLTPTVNLYFNQSGSGRDKEGTGPIKTSKIGLLDQPDGFALNQWQSSEKELTALNTWQIASDSHGIKWWDTDWARVKITKDSYGTLINSIADLTKWYARTNMNLVHGANTDIANSQRLNAGPESKIRAVATKFGERLTDVDNAAFGSNNGVDLYSAAGFGSANGGKVNNYDRLLTKRADIRSEFNQSRPAELRFNGKLIMPIDNYQYISTDWVNNSGGIWGGDRWVVGNEYDNFNLIGKYVFVTGVIFENTSWRNMTSWSRSNQAWITGLRINPQYNNLEIGMQPINNPVGGNWGQYKSFGSANNAKYWPQSGGPAANTNYIDNSSLRYELEFDFNPHKINDPNLNNWISRVPAKFKRSYPVIAGPGEESFAQMFQQYLDWKAQNINASFSDWVGSSWNGTGGVLGLGNVSIKGYLKLNPHVSRLGANNSLFKWDNEYYVVDNVQGKKYIYLDQYNGNRWVYVGGANRFEGNFAWGFGDQARAQLEASLDPNLIGSKNLLMPIDINQISNTLVRGDANFGPVLSFKYKDDATKDKIVVKLKNEEWVNKLSRYLTILCRDLIFQYKDINSNEWHTFFNSNKDENTLLDTWNGQFEREFAVPSQNIEKIRFALIPISESDQRNIIRYIGENQQEVWNDPSRLNAKFLSDEFRIDVQKITVNYNWFHEQLSINNAYITQLNQQQIKSYLDDYKTKILNDYLPEVQRKYIKIHYSFEQNANFVDSDNFSQQIAQKLNDWNSNDLGLFAFYNNTTKNGVKIYAKYILDTTVSGSDLFQLNELNTSDNAIGTDNLKTRYDLSSWVNVLTHNVTIVQGDANNMTITPPSMTGNQGAGFLFGRSFDDVSAALARFGLKIQYNNGKSDQWLFDKPTSYKEGGDIKFRFVYENKPNIFFTLDGATDMVSPSQEFIFNLNVPKSVNIDSPTKEAWINQKPVSGNTFKILIDQQKEIDFIRSIRNYNNTQSSSQNFNDLELIIKYRLGSNGEYRSRQEFIDYLASLNQTQTTNQIDFKIELGAQDPQNPKYVLSKDSVWEGTIYQKNNTDVKIYIHGQAIESALDKVTVGGSKTNIVYNWPAEIQSIFDGITPGLQFQYTINPNASITDPNTTNDPKTGWAIGKPPTNVFAQLDDASTIWIRVVAEPANMYVYGPREDLTITKHVIDLTQISTPIVVDSSWFNQVSLDSADHYVKSLTKQDVLDFEANVWKLSPTITNTPDLLKKVKIVYSFNGNDNLDATALIREISQYEEDNVNAANLGILRLYNSQNGKGLKIQATFAKVKENDKLIEFVDDTGQANTSLQGDVNTDNIKTLIDLTKYSDLIASGTKALVELGTNPGDMNSFTPPAMPAGNGFLDGKTFQDIKNALREFGVSFVFNNTINSGWVVALNKYDPTKGYVEMAIKAETTKAINIDIKFNGQTITKDQDTQNSPLKLNLQAPKRIEISDQLLQAFIQSNPITGNTKNINYDPANITKLINDIKQENVTQSGNDEFNNARLKILFRLGDNGDFREIKQLQDFLAQQSNDQTTNQIQFKFEVENKDPKAPDFIVSDEIKDLYTKDISNNAVLKIFIHKKNLEDLANQVSISGSNKNFTWTWPQGLNVDNNNSLITQAPGIGLEVQYTFSENVDVNAQVGTDIKTEWVKQQPHSYEVGQKVLYIRFVTLDGYVYEAQLDNSYGKHLVDLSKIKEQVEVNKNWLNQPLSPQKININDLNEQTISAYEQSVFNNITSDAVKAKVAIRYDFNGKTDLTKDQLVSEIKALLSTYSKPSLGIVQLWNGVQGLKITSKFVKANESDQSYELIEPTNDLTNIVDSSNVETTIDLQPLVTYLKDNPVKITPGQADFSIDKLLMPNFPGAIDSAALAGYDWDTVVAKLNEIGIRIEWRQVINGAPGNWGAQDTITQYDEFNPIFQIKFILDQAKASNINAAIEAGNNIDAQNTQSNIISINLKVAKKLKVDAQYTDAFINAQDTIGGNTKHIEISADNEKTMIDAIIAANVKVNPIFADAKVYVEYQLGNSGWLKRDEFIAHLLAQTVDQTTNKVEFRFGIENKDPNEPDFAINNASYVLAPEQIGQKDAKVKIFINQSNLEDLANGVSVAGTNTNFTYNWNTLVVDPQTGQVNNIQGLRIQYSIKDGIQNQEYVPGNDPQTGWSDAQVTNIDPVQRYLVIQLVALDGYVYGAQYDNQWAVHVVNTDQIRSEINVNNDELLKLNFNGNVGEIKWNELEQSEQTVLNSIQDATLRSKLFIEYNVSFNGNDTWVNRQGLEQLIEAYITNFNNDTLSMLKFNANGVNIFNSIKARFASNDDKYIPLDPNLNTTEETQKGKEIDTTNIVTTINLTNYVSILESTTVKFDAGSSSQHVSGLVPPAMPGNAGDDFLTGKTFDEIAAALDKVGIEIQFQAPGSASTQDNWVSKDEITTLNRQNELFLRFKLKQDVLAAKDSYAITLKQAVEQLDQAGATTPIRLVVDLPIVIDVDPQDLTAISISGATNGITNLDEIKAKVTEIVDKVKQDNSTQNTQITDANVVVEFSLNEQDLDGNGGVWFQIDEFNAALQASQTNWNTNQVKARFNLVPDQPDKYQLSTKDAQIIFSEQLDNNATFKIYIHTGDYFKNVVADLPASGSSDDYQITNLANWLNTVPQGLSVQFTNAADPTDPQTQWTDAPDLPKPLDSNKNLFIRFVPKAGYIFEESNNTNDPTSGIKLDTTNVKTVIKLQKQWLEQIVLTGNLKELQIDEQAVFDQINQPGILPNGVNDLVEIQYTYDGVNWMSKADLIAKLVELDGALDAENFILKRDSIKARYNLNPTVNVNDEYILNIDGINITNTTTNDERDQFNVQMISDTLNTNVQGYININKLTGFTLNNFEITGSNSAAVLVVKDPNTITALLQKYASDNIFDIIYTTTGTVTNDVWTPDFSDINKKLWDGNQFITNIPDKIGGDKYFAIKFMARANSNYQVYDNNQLLPEGKVIDLTPNVHIRVEIQNPFTTANKSIGLWFRNVDDTPKYFQSHGGFKLSVIDNASGVNDKNQNAIQFVQDVPDSQLTDKQKEALEFVYKVFDEMPNQDEFDQLINPDEINNYDNGQWTIMPDNLDAQGFTESLNLKVNQYVAVALRVKKSAADDGHGGGYTLKGDHSVLSPIAATPGESKGRVNGYKVNTKDIVINWNTVELMNYAQLNQKPLDGFTTIKKLSITKDNEDNYLGIDLNLNRFNSYYLGAQNLPIVTNTNTKLVKRTQTGDQVEQNGFYKSADALDPNVTVDNEGYVLDNQGQRIPIWINKVSKNPSAPEKAAQKTDSIQLASSSATEFYMDVSDDKLLEWGLFANQDLQFEFSGKVGDGTEQLPDFYVDKTTNDYLRDENTSNKIRFPLQNPKAIRYEFKQIDNLKLINPIQDDKLPFEGQAQIDPNAPENNVILTRIEGISEPTEIVGIDAIKQKIQEDFNGKISLNIKFQSIDGGSENVTSIYDKKTLKNKDRFTLSISATNSEDVFAEAPTPLIIVINNLAKKSPELEEMQYLRVEQRGQFNNQGSFRIYVADPNGKNPNADISQVLPGYKFLVRVWDKSKAIKVNWTDNFDDLNKLSNGDKVEWKLVSDNNNELNVSFYNTVATGHGQNPDGSPIYNFAEVNYPNGNLDYSIVKEGIGELPIEDKYPENSGFVIAGLVENPAVIFNINEAGIQKAMNTINPNYYGLNHEGTIRIDEKWLNDKYYINENGDIYIKENKSSIQTQRMLKDSSNTPIIETINEVPLLNFLQQVRYYKNTNPLINTSAEGFNWTSNDHISDGLSNGDSIYVAFMPQRYRVEENTNTPLGNKVMVGSPVSNAETPVVFELPFVHGLTDVSDSMNPLWYVSFAVFGVLTLGTFMMIYVIFRNRKLKGK